MVSKARNHGLIRAQVVGFRASLFPSTVMKDSKRAPKLENPHKDVTLNPTPNPKSKPRSSPEKTAARDELRRLREFSRSATVSGFRALRGLRCRVQR